MTINILIGLLILSVVIVPIALYKRWLSPRFRLIETRYTYDQSSYVPQVRIGGIWYNICESDAGIIKVQPSDLDEFLDHNDAIKHIEQFKLAGNYAIPSNKKLDSNQKSIIIEELLEN